MTLKSCINLLPWRERRYARQCYTLYRNIALLLLILLVTWNGYRYFSNRLNGHIQRQQQHLEQLRLNLTNTVREIKQLQKDYKQQEQRLSAQNPHIMEILDLLTHIPLEQGELDLCIVEPLAQQKMKVTLKGWAKSQTEFEQVHHFLKNHAMITDAKLSQFESQQTGELLFDFILTLSPIENSQ
ncbi:Tfp pilus assembly protein PilN [Cricetibacter osteomyelitidis]|uniref:Tfp pilus assembly protein PilN n=1 Tax=Cricetibacter osteomyelitidis TaxID=1521931 RepID=A0A4R2TA00_9PAST|nr:hypothetical protein [Cricetibacter osteomyelitidis]TCP97694.1 Tfp pilus assembly protein PilN [Cricetibacter osteomyelitidis]